MTCFSHDTWAGALRVGSQFAPSPSHCCHNHMRTYLDVVSVHWIPEWRQWLIPLLTCISCVTWARDKICNVKPLRFWWEFLLLQHNLTHPIYTKWVVIQFIWGDLPINLSQCLFQNYWIRIFWCKFQIFKMLPWWSWCILLLRKHWRFCEWVSERVSTWVTK